MKYILRSESMYSTEAASDFCSASELRGLLKIRQNTAIYGCMSRTAEILHTMHKGETDSQKTQYSLIFSDNTNKI